MHYLHTEGSLDMLVTIALVMLLADKKVVKKFLFDFQLFSKLIF